MQIGQVIRKYRKEQNLTQEEINAIICEVDERFQKDTYDETYRWIKEKIEMYPNCKTLIWQLANILDGQRMMQGIAEKEPYESYILNCYERVLDSEEEEMKACAADSLFGYYLRKEEYEKAESYLTYFSKEDPERKRKQALIYSETGRREEAYKAYEELLFHGYQSLNVVFNNLYILAMQDNNVKKAYKMTDKRQELARLFEMGTYHEVSCRLEPATAEKDADIIVDTMQKMLESIDGIMDFAESDLYEHMSFQKPRKEFIEGIKENLLKCFRDEETYGFLQEDERWNALFTK